MEPACARFQGNESLKERVIVIFEVWHPDLDGRERAAISTMFGEIDPY